MVSVKDWKTANCADTDDSDHVEAIEALASLLEGDITPSDAAKMITKAYEASLKAIEGVSEVIRDYETKLHEFWGFYMTDAICLFGSAEEHERLFELLVEISRQPDLEDYDGMVVTSKDHKTFWVDLPGWNRHFVDDGLDYRSARDHQFCPENRNLSQELLKATRFAAILLSRNKFVFTLPRSASSFLAMGLEHPYDNNSRHLAGVDREEWETFIPAATTWLLIAGKTIYEHCREDDPYDWWERGRWNLQRWNLWKEQLGRFAKREDFNDECRDLAAQTVRKMAEVEFSVSVQNFTQKVCRHTEDPCHFEAADALALLLNGEADADDTARSITTIYEVELKSENESTNMHDEEQVWYFWTYHMCGAICTFGSTELRERLFDLLVAISKRPDVTTPNGSVKKYHDRSVYWRDVPGWALNFATQAPYYNSPEPWRPGWKDDYVGQATELLNGTRFAAMLLEKDAFTIGLPAEASDALKRGIEQLYSDQEYDTDGSDDDIDSLKAEVLLPATASWLLIAGKAIYSHCLKNEVARYGADIETRQGWGGGTWTLHRWNFWQEQLHDIADRDNLNEECRDVVMKTLKKMTEVEAEHDAR